MSDILQYKYATLSVPAVAILAERRRLSSNSDRLQTHCDVEEFNSDR